MSEAVVIHHAPDVVEYRVQRPSKHDYTSWAVIPSLIAIVALAVRHRCMRLVYSPTQEFSLQSTGSTRQTLLLLMLVFVLYRKSACILHESVISLYPHGLQLETHRGIQASFFTPSISLFVTRKFIATPMILDVILNEGLRRWNFHYYLAIICRARENLTEPVIIHVAYPNILPHFRIVKQVYLGVHQDLFVRDKKEH